MPFLDTAPADIDRAGPGSLWARFRVDDARQIRLNLHMLCRSDAPVTIGVPQGPTFVATLWSVDDARKLLHFSIDRAAVVDAHLLRANRLWAVSYDDGVKLQFELRRFVLEDGAERRLLHTGLPSTLYRLPRRGAVRVRPAEVGAPKVRFRHPLAPEHWTQLRAIDIAPSGCALWRPLDALPLPPGMVLMQAEVELDEETYFYADLSIQHVTLGPLDEVGRAVGMRVGCRWDGLAPPAEVALARWLRSGQGRRDRIALSFDDSKP